MLVLAAIMILLLTLFFTKICLPFSRIHSDILAIAQGDLTRKIGYRPDDLSSNMGENLNLMTTAFNSKLNDIEGEFKKIINLASHKQLPELIALELIRLHSSIKNDFIL
jgi:methyl-accepting chemotaxis protein